MVSRLPGQPCLHAPSRLEVCHAAHSAALAGCPTHRPQQGQLAVQLSIYPKQALDTGDSSICLVSTVRVVCQKNTRVAGEDVPADAPRFWREAFRLRPRRGGAGGGVAAPALLAPAAPALLAAGKATLLLRAARTRLDARRATARAANCVRLCTGVCGGAARPAQLALALESRS
jgi:hypothetical protein